MNLQNDLLKIIRLRDPDEKVSLTAQLNKAVKEQASLDIFPQDAIAVDHPGLPETLELVRPKQLERRSVQSQQGRSVLMHAIAHIEFNAINLALDAAYRFSGMPEQFYRDWIFVAADEARHFSMIREYLLSHGADYGDFPAHNGLWDMAVKTAHDVLPRMALVPRVMEARGLDVTPGMIGKLERAGDAEAVAILETIYKEEIEHVRIGSHWYRFVCESRGLDPDSTFFQLVDKYFVGELRGPFNLEARRLSGFGEMELERLGHAV